MKRLGFALAVSLILGATALAQAPAGKDLLWAFPVASAVVNKPPLPVAEGPQQIQGSAKSYTQKDLDSTFAAVDWFPDQHLPMPKIVRDGTANGGFACASCHLANGRGHPESGDLAGQTEAYILKTMAEFKAGIRNEPTRMTTIAKTTSDEDTKEAAKWFASLKDGPEPWTKVIETKTVPHTYIGPGRMRFIDPDNKGEEPIGQRIITLPQDVPRVRARDPRIGFNAYVPVGSLARGKALVEGGGAGKTVQCAICHGEGLKGLGNVPAIAGRHPIYVARQLYDVQTGARNGPDAQMMKRVVAKLSDADIVAVSAYVASLPR